MTVVRHTNSHAYCVVTDEESVFRKNQKGSPLRTWCPRLSGMLVKCTQNTDFSISNEYQVV